MSIFPSELHEVAACDTNDEIRHHSTFGACRSYRRSDNLASRVRDAIRRGRRFQLNWSRSIRQTHRWLSIIFTLAVIINGITVVQRRYNNRLGLSAVAILAFLLFTGLYLFALPYVNKWRR
jgi:hypothetical protein